VLAQLAALPEEDLPGDAVAGLGHVELGADQPPVSLVGDVLQQVQRLEDPAVVSEGVADVPSCGH
jgi:hypothetical protein